VIFVSLRVVRVGLIVFRIGVMGCCRKLKMEEVGKDGEGLFVVG